GNPRTCTRTFPAGSRKSVPRSAGTICPRTAATTWNGWASSSELPSSSSAPGRAATSSSPEARSSSRRPLGVKPNTPVAAELTWPQVHAFRLQRHHLAGRAAQKDLARAVGDIGGVQAQLMSAAELQIAVRVDCTVADVRKALWTERTLVKTWLMRGTLHLIPAEDLPLYTAAMSGRWMRLRPSWLKYMQTTESEFWKLANDVGAALDGEPLTREELIDVVGKGKSPHIHEVLRSGWGGMLKPAARSGLLCFGP